LFWQHIERFIWSTPGNQKSSSPSLHLPNLYRIPYHHHLKPAATSACNGSTLENQIWGSNRGETFAMLIGCWRGGGGRGGVEGFGAAAVVTGWIQLRAKGLAEVHSICIAVLAILHSKRENWDSSSSISATMPPNLVNTSAI